VGGRAKNPAIEGLFETGFVNFESFFGDKFPAEPYKRLLIIGGGIIGTEFAHIFSAYGAEVTIMDHNPRLAKHEEPEVSALLEKEFRRVGIRVRTGVEPIRAEKVAGEKHVTLRDKVTGSKEVIATDEIFIATGFVSNSDWLQADRCGLLMDERGYITTNKLMETNVPGVYAAR